MKGLSGFFDSLSELYRFLGVVWVSSIILSELA